jgi:hypothetical protein
VTRFGDCLYIVNSFLHPEEEKSDINYLPALKLSHEESITIVEEYLSYSIF